MSHPPPQESFHQAAFVKSAADRAGWPTEGMPEIAFVGRSNVGKSSLLNTMLGRKGLAKVSGTPGKTRLINFFDIGGKWMFVDLPGYGFARVGREERRGWQKMIEDYLTLRRSLAAVALLLDFRHVPVEEDLQMADWLLAGEIPMIPVLTKADKLSGNERPRMRRKIAEAMGRRFEPSMSVEFSAVTGLGREALWERVAGLAEAHSGFSVTSSR